MNPAKGMEIVDEYGEICELIKPWDTGISERWDIVGKHFHSIEIKDARIAPQKGSEDYETLCFLNDGVSEAERKLLSARAERSLFIKTLPQFKEGF